jgi:hypothetical protein
MTVGTRADRFRFDARNRLPLSAATARPTRAGGAVVSVVLPGANQRWRCGGCGNLTRFDVARTRRTTEFWHFDLAGEHTVESTELRDEVVESVTCRWCGRADAVEVVDRAGVDAADSPGS